MTKRRYQLTPARRRALRKAQLTSAKKRFGTHKHEFTHFVKKGIVKVGNTATLGAGRKAANFIELVESGKRRK